MSGEVVSPWALNTALVRCATFRSPDIRIRVDAATHLKMVTVTLGCEITNKLALGSAAHLDVSGALIDCERRCQIKNMGGLHPKRIGLPRTPREWAAAAAALSGRVRVLAALEDRLLTLTYSAAYNGALWQLEYADARGVERVSTDPTLIAALGAVRR